MENILGQTGTSSETVEARVVLLALYGPQVIPKI